MRIPDGQQHEHLDSDLTRRAFVAGAGAMGLLALAPPARVRGLLATAPAVGQPGHFLTAHELEVLGALADRLIPGPPEDPTPVRSRLAFPTRSTCCWERSSWSRR